MRTHVLILALMSGALIAQAPAHSQEYRGTWEQQMACTPDVMRLCGDQIPDVSRIVACLRQNVPRLSSGCRAVFESNAAQANPRVPSQQLPPPRARTAPPQQPAPVRPRPDYYYDDE